MRFSCVCCSAGQKNQVSVAVPQNSEQVFLPKETLLTIQQEETHTSAKLVNPGARSYYLFVFNRVVRAKDISGFRIVAPDGNPPQTEFSVCLIGYWF